MGRPARLCKLAKGKVIDAQDGFVETFNWMVDFINNLCGDGEKIELTNPTGTNPVVRFKGGNDKAQTNPGIKVYAYGDTVYDGITEMEFSQTSNDSVHFAVAKNGDHTAIVTAEAQYID